MKQYLSLSITTALVLIFGGIASATNIFVADYPGNTVAEINPGGGQSTFASGLAILTEQLLMAQAMCLYRMMAPAISINTLRRGQKHICHLAGFPSWDGL